MQAMGFDDERVRDEYEVEVERRRRAAEAQQLVVDWQALLREMMAEIDAANGASAWERFRVWVEELVARVVAAVRPLVEELTEMGEAVLAAVGRVMELVGEAREERRGPRHVACRCLPVERVDPVRAGRKRWWTRN